MEEIDAKRERHLEYRKAYYQKNKERFAEYQRDYIAKNRKRISERSKAYAHNNPEKIFDYRISTYINFLEKHGYEVKRIDL